MHEKHYRAGYSKPPLGAQQEYYATRFVHCKGRRGKGQRGVRRNNQQGSGVYRARHRMEGQEVSGSTICVQYLQPHEQDTIGKESTTSYLLSIECANSFISWT